MADILTRQLLSASFRGISFSVRGEARSGGRRIVLHEYPNSNRRDIEDLGLIQPTFVVDAFIAGDNWLTRAEAFRNALSEPGIGTLIIPVFGSFLAYAMPFTEDAGQRSVGEIKFSVTFVVGDSNRAPSKNQAEDIEDVFDFGDVSRESLEDKFEELWIDPIETPNVKVAQFDVVSMVQTVKALSAGVITVADEVSSIADLITKGVSSFVRDGEDLASAIFTGKIIERIGLYQAVSTALDKSRNAFDSIVKLTGFGSDLLLSLSDISGSKPENTVIFEGTEIPLWPSNTAGRLIRNSNRKILVQSTRIAAIISAYEQAAAIDYLTQEEAQAVRGTVEAAYEDIYQNQVNDITAIQNQTEIKKALSDTRESALSVLSDKEQQAFALTDFFSVSGISSLNLAYKLYAEEFNSSEGLEARADQLRALNPEQSGAKLIEAINIFQTSQRIT